MTVNPTNLRFFRPIKIALSGKVCPELSMRDRKYMSRMGEILCKHVQVALFFD